MRVFSLLLLVLFLSGCWSTPERHSLVFMSDFGTQDGAVSSMHGVARTIDRDLDLQDLTHEVPPFNIWEGAYRLHQTAPYWPVGTVFVCVVDPGVGTDRKSVVMRTKSGHYFVTPDNGTLTLVADNLGIEAVREIDERKNRMKGSEKSHTFHGRDVYAVTGARLASGAITFDEVGPSRPSSVVRLPYQKAAFEAGACKGTIPVLDVQYGNVWTNVDRATFKRLGLYHGQPVRVRILHGGREVYTGVVPFVRTFGDVAEGKPLLYFNSQDQVALALNMGSFARTHGISAGAAWHVVLSPGS